MSDPRQMQFWQDEEGELWDAMISIILDAHTDGVTGGVAALPANVRPLTDFDFVNQAALDFAKNYRYKWIKEINDTTRKQTQQAISDWMQSGESLDALDKKLANVYGENRASQIAATEITRAFAQGNMDAWESTGVVEGGTWMTARDEDTCDICSENDGETVGIGDIDAAPPAHVNCRCYLQPIVSDELIQNKINEIFG